LAESYEGHSKIEIKKLYEAYLEIDTACNLIIEDKKIEKQQKPKVKKEVSKTKIIEKLKYQIRDDNLKVVSINPVDIIGAKELWVFNTKTRKIGKYIAINTLTVKGTHILGFDEEKSIQKTLRKPIETLTEFKATGKVALRKFMDNINSVDIKLTGKINTDILLLKVIKE
jgi:hypothetical protein